MRGRVQGPPADPGERLLRPPGGGGGAGARELLTRPRLRPRRPAGRCSHGPSGGGRSVGRPQRRPPDAGAPPEPEPSRGRSRFRGRNGRAESARVPGSGSAAGDMGGAGGYGARTASACQLEGRAVQACPHGNSPTPSPQYRTSVQFSGPHTESVGELSVRVRWCPGRRRLRRGRFAGHGPGAPGAPGGRGDAPAPAPCSLWAGPPGSGLQGRSAGGRAPGAERCAPGSGRPRRWCGRRTARRGWRRPSRAGRALLAVERLQAGQALGGQDQAGAVLGQLGEDRLVVGPGHGVELVDHQRHRAGAPRVRARPARRRPAPPG